MPSLLSNVTWVHQVMDVVERGLIDERVEVRSKAGQVLGGLLHCAFVDKERQDSLLVSLSLIWGFKSPLYEGWNLQVHCHSVRSCAICEGAKRVFSY